MSVDRDLLEKIEVLEQTGRGFLDQSTSSGPSETAINAHEFHRWRVNVSKLLYLSLGPSNYYYECFWKTVTRPSRDHLNEGLRLLATVKSELLVVLPSGTPLTARDAEAPEEVDIAKFQRE